MTCVRSGLARWVVLLGGAVLCGFDMRMVVRVSATHLAAPSLLCLFCPPMLYSGCPGLLDLYAEPRKGLGEIIIPEGNSGATTAPGKDAMHRHHPPAVRSRWRFFLLQAILPSYEAEYALQSLYFR